VTRSDAVAPAAPPGGPPGFAGRTIARSALWRFAEALGSEAAALVVFVLMARLLAPEQFGVVALAGVLVIGGQVVLQQGLGEAVVQGRAAGAVRLATAFWSSLGLGLGLMALVALAALPAARLFAEPVLAPVLLALAPVLPLTGAAAILQARLARRLAFKAIAIRALVATAAGGAVGLALAAGGAGVWALVGQQLANATAGLAVLVIADPWRPRLVVDRRELRALWRFALPVMGTHLTKFCGKRLDVALLGLFVPAAALGHYFLATRLILALGMATHYLVFSLTLPVLARLVASPAAFAAAAGRTLWLAAGLCLPAGLGLALIADLLVPLAFGDAWRPAVPPLQLLAGFSIFYALGLIAGQILVAAGRPALFFRLTLVNTTIFLVAVAIAAPMGLAAVAAAGGLANTLLLPAYLHFLRRHAALDLSAELRRQLPVWLAAGLMVGVVLAARQLAGPGAAPAQTLGWALASGIASYAAALRLLARATLAGLVASLRR